MLLSHAATLLLMPRCYDYFRRRHADAAAADASPDGRRCCLPLIFRRYQHTICHGCLPLPVRRSLPPRCRHFAARHFHVAAPHYAYAAQLVLLAAAAAVHIRVDAVTALKHFILICYFYARYVVYGAMTRYDKMLHTRRFSLICVKRWRHATLWKRSIIYLRRYAPYARCC